ncbi:adhesin HecA-like repeat protein [Pseudomonas psychrotolerans]|nr:adhesin HecA-like repeat protein [Pseudomonas psychrotolerans]
MLAQGDLLLKRATQVANRKGRLNSGGLLTLLVGGLDNSNGGTLAGQSGLRLTASGQVSNGGDGLLASQGGALSVTASALDNNGGTLQSATGLTVATGSGTVGNAGGKLLAQNGDLSITAGSLDNRGGILASLQGAFTAGISGLLANGGQGQAGGTVQAQRLDLSAGTLSNYNGKLSALGGDALIQAGSVDNRNGSLYGKGLVRVRGGSFDNSGDNDGQVFGNQIDFSLSGALNNRLGIIESNSTLNLAAASLDNINGKLRALGSGGTTLLSLGGTLDNTNGRLESANQNLQLNLGGLTNANGTLLHVGTGTFGLGLPLLQNAGGSVTSNGTLTLSGSSWTNSSTLQVANLVVNVDNLTQIGSGQLIASNSFNGNGGNWTNDGLISAGGNFSLALGGTYQGAGRLSSGYDFTLNAGQLLLDNPNARLTAGSGTTTFNLGGLLRNQARITSAGNFTLNAGQVDNRGTLGASGNLTINTLSLTNQNSSLIFSGGDMAFGVNDFTNRYADVYSLGRLLVARDSSATQRASRFENISATMESAGDMTLRVDELINRKDILNYNEQFLSGDIAYECLNCKGRHYDLYYYVTQKLKRVISADSRSASLLSGGSLQANSNNFSNRYSVISASRDIDIRTGDFENTGAADSVVERFLQYRNPNDSESKDVFYSLIGEGGAVNEYNKYMAERKHRYLETVRLGGRDGGTETRFLNRNEQVLNESNPDYSPSRQVALPGIFSTYTQVDSRETVTSTGASAMAVVQAGGSVRIEASQNLSNGLVQQGIGAQRGGNRTQNTQVPGVAVQTTVTFNSQLPPDLAQQQVNPTTLPGFSLPTGQNGLFRLSGQQNSAADIKTGSHAQWLAKSQVAVGDQVSTQAATYISGRTENISKTLVSTESTSIVSVVLPTTVGHYLPHRYLVETNPALTDLKQFMSSDYLLGNLNYNPDTSWKRLGDGLYEQRLVQQAIVARTGQRFIAGLNSDEAQFKYLMDNAIASKQALGLSVGVSLTAAQVAALTHDIVWMEDQVINGEHVLVPVLYLAHANNRLAPNGALIQGSDVTLIAGNDLNNAGTLRATNNLTATANNDLVNSGLIQSGDRLSLTSTLGDITNRAGGIISGRDVSLTASRGDILNERTVTTHTASYAGQSLREDYADSAAHIEAGNNLSLIAGRDINNVGSVLSAGGNATLIAGRDVNLISAQTQTGRSSGANNTSSSITQLTGSLTAGRDLGIGAGRNLTAVATTLSAGRNASLAAQENLTLAAAADETHSYSKSKKVTRQEDHVSQQITTLTAGGNVSLMANQGDLTLVASKVAAGGEAYLYAGKDLNLLAAQDSDYSLYDMKKKGSFGAKKTKRDEVTDVRNIGSEIKAGGDITLQSEGNQTYQAAKLQSGKDLTIDSGGDVTFAAVKDLHQESHEKSGSSAVWQSAKGKGNTDETLQQSQLVAQGQLAINAVQGLKIDVKEVNGQTVSQTIDAMVKADPNLAWIKQAEERGDVDWRQVKEIHDSFKYSQSGLGGAAAMVIAIVVAYFTAGLASGMVATMAGAGGATAGAATGAVAGAATAAGTTAATGTSIWAAATATTAAGWANAAASAALTSMASSGAVNLINNRGNIGATLKDTLSSDGMKNAMIAAATAALTVGVYDKWTGTSTATNTAGTATGNTGVLANSGAVSTAGSLSTWSGVGHFAANQALQNGTSTLLNRALGRGGSLGDALQTTLANTFAAVGFNFVGDISQHRFEDGSLAKIGLHAVMGGLAAEAAGGDFKTGALAAGVNEALVASLAKQYANMPEDKKKSLLVMNSQLIGVFAAAAQGSNEKGLQTGAWVAANGTQYNFLSHQSQTLRDELRKKVEEGATPQEAEKLIALEHADQQSDYLLEKYRQDPNSMTAIEQQDLERYLRNFSYDQLREYGFAKASKDVNSLLKEGNSFKDYEFPYAAGREARDQAIVAERSKIDSALGQLSWLRDKTENEEIFNSAQKSVRIQNALQGEANLGQPALYFLPGGFGMAFRAAEAINGANQLGHGIDQAITGDAWNAAGNIVMGALGTAGMAGSVGSARGVISTGAKEIPAGLSDVWKLSPTQRGVEIESYLAKADYSSQNGWYNVGAERNGYFPLVDFQNGNTLVSLKSVDTSGSTWLARMQNHIIDLGTNGAKVNDMPANMVLDLRVQPGGSARC